MINTSVKKPFTKYVAYIVIAFLIVSISIIYFLVKEKAVHFNIYDEDEKIIAKFYNFLDMDIKSGYYYKNSDSNVVVIDLMFKGGSALDPKGSEGISKLLAEAISLGGGDYNILSFQKALEDYSITLSSGATRDNIYIRVKVLNKYLDKALNILESILIDPTLGEKELNLSKNNLITSMKINQNNPEYILDKAVRKELFPNNEYYRDQYGNAESIQSINKEKLLTFKNKVITRSNTYLAVSGNIDVKDISTKLNRIFSKLPENSFNIELPKINIQIQPKIIEVPQINATQTTIYIIYKVPTPEDNNYTLAKLFTVYLGGIADSILFNELRNKQGLVYGINSQIASNELTTFGVIELATSNDNADKAIDSVLDILKDIPHTYNLKDIKITQEWLLNYGLRKYATNDNIASFINDTAFKGISFEEYLQRIKSLQNITQDKVDNMLKEIDFNNVVIFKTVAK